MINKELESAYREIEAVEMDIAEIELTLLDIEISKEVYYSFIPETSHSRKKVEWLLKVNDNLNWADKVALVAEHNKKILEERLEKAKEAIDKVGKVEK